MFCLRPAVVQGGSIAAGPFCRAVHREEVMVRAFEAHVEREEM